MENQSIEITDLGSGSSHFKNNTRAIAAIARTSLSTPTFSQFYNRLIHHYNATTVIELGTSLGINALYLAQKKDVNLYTFEGASAIAEIARQTFAACQASNINLIEGDITQTLPAFLQSYKKLDVIFMDANHRYEFSKRYVEWLLPYIHQKTILILDDIYYSNEMRKAWKEIRQHDMVYGSVDIFRCGLVFFDPSLHKQHLVLQFNH